MSYQAGQLLRLAGRNPNVRIPYSKGALGLVLVAHPREPWSSQSTFQVSVEGERIVIAEHEIVEVVQ